MRILVAPQEFKGTLTAVEAAEAMARAQAYVHQALTVAYSIANGQAIPNRRQAGLQENS